MAEIVLTCLACYVIADFISGLGHWIEDTYGSVDWPILGKLIIYDNIKHHKDPGGMARTFLDRNLLNAGVVGGLGLAFGLFGYYCWQSCLVLTLLAFSNETHAWCHGLGRNKFVLLLQEMGLVISPINHGHHHRSPYAKSFCVMTNWVNPILDRVYFWQGLEWSISLAGIHPKRLSKERQYV